MTWEIVLFLLAASGNALFVYSKHIHVSEGRKTVDFDAYIDEARLNEIKRQVSGKIDEAAGVTLETLRKTGTTAARKGLPYLKKTISLSESRRFKDILRGRKDLTNRGSVSLHLRRVSEIKRGRE